MFSPLIVNAVRSFFDRVSTIGLTITDHFWSGDRFFNHFCHFLVVVGRLGINSPKSDSSDQSWVLLLLGNFTLRSLRNNNFYKLWFIRFIRLHYSAIIKVSKINNWKHFYIQNIHFWYVLEHYWLFFFTLL